MNKKFTILIIGILFLAITRGIFWWQSDKKEVKKNPLIDKYQSCLDKCGEKFGAVGLPARMICNSECDEKYLK